MDIIHTSNKLILLYSKIRFRTIYSTWHILDLYFVFTNPNTLINIQYMFHEIQQKIGKNQNCEKQLET